MIDPSFKDALISSEPIKRYWKTKLERVRKAFEKNNFEAFVADSTLHAKCLVMEDILSGTGAKSIAWDCTSPTRICNAWSIIEKSFPARRIKIVLINEDLGV